jgi:gluconate 2-dehydrogenase gamma chain
MRNQAAQLIETLETGRACENTHAMRNENSTKPKKQMHQLDRRQFVHRLTFFGGGSVLLGCKNEAPPSVAPKGEIKTDALVTSHVHFTNAEFAMLSAAVDRMIPADETPGALAANVPEYIDRVLSTEQLRTMKQNFVPGLLALDRKCQRIGGQGLASATPAHIDEAIAAFKNSPEKSGESRWYEMLIVLVLEGFLGDPSYGGNQNQIGWSLVGFSLVGNDLKGDPKSPYDGRKSLQDLRCGTKKGC